MKFLVIASLIETAIVVIAFLPVPFRLDRDPPD